MELFNDGRAATLRAAIDRIIPADDFSAGGVDAGVYEYISRNLAPGGYFPQLIGDYENGLAAIDALARGLSGSSFVALDSATQDAVLVQFESEQPAFWRLFVEQAQEGFYTSPAGFDMIGWRVTG